MNFNLYLERTLGGYQNLIVNGVPVPVTNSLAKRLQGAGVSVLDKNVLSPGAKAQTIGELLGENMSDKDERNPVSRA